MPVDSTNQTGGAQPEGEVALVDSHQTVETLGGTTARDVQEAIFMATASGVTFPVRVPLTTANRADRTLLKTQLLNIAATRAGYVAQALMIPGVVGLYATQQVNASNEIEDHWIVTVESGSGQSTTTIDVPFRNFVPALEQLVPPAVAGLDELEAVGLA